MSDLRDDLLEKAAKEVSELMLLDEEVFRKRNPEWTDNQIFKALVVGQLTRITAQLNILAGRI